MAGRGIVYLIGSCWAISKSVACSVLLVAADVKPFCSWIARCVRRSYMSASFINSLITAYWKPTSCSKSRSTRKELPHIVLHRHFPQLFCLRANIACRQDRGGLSWFSPDNRTLSNIFTAYGGFVDVANMYHQVSEKGIKDDNWETVDIELMRGFHCFYFGWSTYLSEDGPMLWGWRSKMRWNVEDRFLLFYVKATELLRAWELKTSLKWMRREGSKECHAVKISARHITESLWRKTIAQPYFQWLTAIM